MKVIYLSLIISFIFYSSKSFGQVEETLILKSSQNLTKFIYQGEIYSFSNMGHVFDQDMEMKNQYLVARKTYSNAAGLGWTSITSIVTAGILSKMDSEPSPYQLVSGGQTIAAFLIAFIAPATGIAASIALLKYEIRKNRLIQKFNSKIHEKEGSLNDATLKLGSTTNGFGLTLTF